MTPPAYPSAGQDPPFRHDPPFDRDAAAPPSQSHLAIANLPIVNQPGKSQPTTRYTTGFPSFLMRHCSSGGVSTVVATTIATTAA